MSSVNTFVVNVSRLVRRPGSTRQVAVAGQVELALDQVEECGPVTADLRLEAMAGGVWVSGVASAEMVLRCNRCLDRVGFEARAPVRQVYGEDALDDMPAIGQEGDIDLSGALHDELCLSVPLAPLCSESCRGLCPVCGADLNEGSCEGHSESRESPFATLEALLEVPFETA